MDRRRLALIAVALLAGGAAFYLSMRTGEQPAPAPVVISQPAPKPTVDVLVAAKALEPGEQVSPDSVKWQSMVEESLPEGALTRRTSPEAQTELAGQVVLQPIRIGEPVRQDRLRAQDEGGMLAGMLGTGMRAVSIPLDARNVRAVSGFIAVNDRVDVAITLPSDPSGRVAGQIQTSRLLLQNIRVIALGHDLARTQIIGQKLTLPEVATLEVTPEQANQLLMAMRQSGAEVSLMLRPVGEKGEIANPQEDRQIITIRFGRAQ